MKASSFALLAGLGLIAGSLSARDSSSLVSGPREATISTEAGDEFRRYELTTNIELRDNTPPDKRATFQETAEHARIRTGNLLFDGLYALAVSEAVQNSVTEISDGAYAKGAPFPLEAFQTGERWTYVWTRDLSYSVHLALAGFDPRRAVNSLLFKTSELKPSVSGGLARQVIQDTGSGGSYPVSTDRAVWALGAQETLKYLSGPERQSFLEKVFGILSDTIEQDRRLIFDPEDGLYRGEQSFLDWREQTYPAWTKDNVIGIAMSKALSANALQYFLLQSAAADAAALGQREVQARYAEWAAELKSAINRHFPDAKAGLYSTCLISDGGPAIRVQHYDLLGESLAVLLGIADSNQARAILRNYPTGPFGPPVVWPQEPSTPIYHNQSIWPFVTAYWVKAAQKYGAAEAVDAGLESMQQLAATNLSNMENFDFLTGRSEVKEGPRPGPQINSRRQLWSVAGYLSVVQDVVFGLETSMEGLRFRPFITARMRDHIFKSADVIEWRGFRFRGREHRVRVHLPPADSFAHETCAIERAELNGKAIDGEFTPPESLQPHNDWDLYLKAPTQATAPLPLRQVDAGSPDIFSPVPPQWDDAKNGGVSLEQGRLTLHLRAPGEGTVFHVYRDGKFQAETREKVWTDPDSADFQDRVHSYAVTAFDPKTGLESHLTPTRSYRADDQRQIIPAKELQNQGGNLVDGHHFENWGRRDHELISAPIAVKRRGHFLLRAEFSNGSGPVNTGITCAVKRIEIRQEGTAEPRFSGYLVMPQSGDWQRWDLSSTVKAELDPALRYTIRICEDEYSRNMSYLDQNRRYTNWSGGGESASNYVNIAALHLLFVEGTKP